MKRPLETQFVNITITKEGIAMNEETQQPPEEETPGTESEAEDQVVDPDDPSQQSPERDRVEQERKLSEDDEAKESEQDKKDDNE